ncbi:MAG: aminopeptidase [Woeseiaceae bacterium]
MLKKFKISLLIISALTVSACTSFGYYMDLMAGHSELLEQQKPVAELVEDKNTPEKLRELLVKSQKIRDFASKSLLLPENDSYRHYADIKRPYALWNVIATKEFSIEPKKWCYIFVGCMSYRGYFSKQEAIDYAAELKSQGFDVHVAGAKAYSTLGWFDDPLLNTMMYKSEARRAGIIFHELSHQLIYIDNDSAFNEAFATTVEQEGVRRWMLNSGKEKQYATFLLDKKRDTQINQILLEIRASLKELYLKALPVEKMRQEKAGVFHRMEGRYQQLKKTWQQDKNKNDYDPWMLQGLNNSHLSLIATYHHLVPVFNQMLENTKHDLKVFYTNVEQVGELNKKKRTTYLNDVKLIKTLSMVK